MLVPYAMRTVGYWRTPNDQAAGGEMKERLLIAIILICTFVGFFLVTTWVCDSYDHATGYYLQGMAESAEVGQE